MTPYSLTLRVYFEDTDAGGIMYHARYLAFGERGRTEALRQAGVPHSELVTDYGLIFVVHRVEMDYLRPARLDDTLVVLTGPWVLSPARIVVTQRIERDGVVLATARVMLAAVSNQGRPARIPDRWVAALEGVS